ncbi:MAG: ATP synthase F0 subunit B [Candidatus Ancillula sp.]|jgi:F-type H+-transporting ATPase subunit b|nr:ATP synthase F0 subunit B [Candidatus Ancillula sp.]
MNDALVMLAEDEPDGIDLFLPGFPELFWSAFCIIVLAIVFYKFVLPKMNEVLDLRTQKIEGQIAEATTLKSEAEELHSKYTEEIKNTRVEAAQIKDDARQEASAIIQDARTKAVASADLIQKNAVRAINSEKKAVENELKKHVGSLAMEMLNTKLIHGLENNSRQSTYIDQALDRLDEQLNDADYSNGNNSKGNTKKVSNKTVRNGGNAENKPKVPVSKRPRKRIVLEEL